MNNKYYTPSKEELCIGLEFEEEFKNPNWHKLARPSQDVYEFVKLKLDTSHSISRIIQKIKTDKVRIKFLDREDIESLGWSLDQKVDGDYFFMIGNMLDGDYMLTTDNFKNVFITPMIGNSKGGIFEGVIKNKSELKKIMQMLNIKTA